MTTETEMQRIIGSILWTSGEAFVGNRVSTSEEAMSEYIKLRGD